MSYDREDNGRYKELRFNCPNDSISCDNIHDIAHQERRNTEEFANRYTHPNNNEHLCCFNYSFIIIILPMMSTEISDILFIVFLRQVIQISFDRNRTTLRRPFIGSRGSFSSPAPHVIALRLVGGQTHKT